MQCLWSSLVRAKLTEGYQLLLWNCVPVVLNESGHRKIIFLLVFPVD